MMQHEVATLFSMTLFISLFENDISNIQIVIEFYYIEIIMK